MMVLDSISAERGGQTVVKRLSARLEADTASLAKLKGRRVLDFAGIGDPQRFFRTLRAGRIDVVREHKAMRLLVAGVDPSVTKTDLARRIAGSRPWLACCVDLGSESVDTRSNAEEAGRWLARHNYKSVRLITSDWHMRRARYEFEKVLGRKYALTTDAVRTEPSFLTLFGEYNKYLLRRLAVWADL